MRTERVCRLEETPRTGPHEAPGCVLFKPLFETCRGARSARTPSEDQVSARVIFISLTVRLLLWRTIPGIFSYPSVFCLRLRTKRVKGIPQISSSLISYRNTIVLTFNSLCSWKIRHVESMQVLVFILFVRNWWGVFAPNCLVRPLPLTSFPLHELISLFLFLLSLRHVLISLGFAVVNTEVSVWMATRILFRFFLRLLFDWTLQSWSSWISTVDEAWFFT